MAAATGTQYPDLRVRYVRLLCRKAHKKTKNARFAANELPHYARAVVSIALHPAALYSCHQAGELSHVGDVRKQELQNQAEINRTGKQPPPRGKYASAAEAVLVALREFEETHGSGAEMPGAELHKSMVRLLEATPAWTSHVQTLDKLFPPTGGVGTPCVAWEQVKALLKVFPPLLTEHGRKRLCSQTGKAYVLTEDGRGAAELAAERSTGTWPPKSSTLYPAPVQSGLLLLVDNREGAGETHHLAEIMANLKAAGVPAETAHLRSGLGDYLFVHRRRTRDGDSPTDFAVPRIIERKLTSAASDDLAESMRDGRWVTQQAAMTRMAEMIGNGCKKIYLIQGKMRAFNCQCGCSGFGGCCVDKNASQDSQDDDEDNLPRTTWYSFARAKDEVESLPSRGYEVRMVTSDRRQSLALALRQEFDEVKRDYKAGRHKNLPSVSELRLARNTSASPGSANSGMQLQLERWTPPPASASVDNNDGSGRRLVGTVGTAIALGAMGPSPSRTDNDDSSSHINGPNQQYNQQHQHQHQRTKRARATNQPARAKSLKIVQMKDALKRRGDWLPAKKPELLSRLQSNMPEDIARRLREAHRVGHDPSKEGMPRLRSIGFGFLARASQEPEGSIWTEQDMLELARDSYRLRWCSTPPDAANGSHTASYNGMSSIKDLTKAGSGKEGGVSLMIVKGRGGKRYKLSSEGRLLAEACHLLCHDSHRIDASNADNDPSNVCSCSRCPQAQPNSVFDNFFVQDSLGRLYNTDGKPKVHAASAASIAGDSESDDADDDVSTTRDQRRRIDSSLTGQSPATVNSSSKLSAAKRGSRASASWIDDLSDPDSDDELAGWDVASSPEADEVDEDRNDLTAPSATATSTASAPSTSTSALLTASPAAAMVSDAPVVSGIRSGRMLFNGGSDGDNATSLVSAQPKDDTEPEEDEEDESQTPALSDDDCAGDFGGNEDATQALSDSQDLDYTLKLSDKYGGASSLSPDNYPVASPSTTPARAAQSLAQGGEATWSVRLGGHFQDYPSDMQPRLNLAYKMWRRHQPQDHNQDQGGNSVSPSFISDNVVFQRHGVEYRILFSLGRMFQERLDNGRKREVQRSRDTPTAEPTVEQGSVGAHGTRATPHPGAGSAAGIAKADAATTILSSFSGAAAAALPRRSSSEARLPVPASRHGDLASELSPSTHSSNIPWSTAEIEDLQRAMVEHGRVGRWNSIRGDPRYRFHPSRTAADLQQEGKQLSSGVTAAIERFSPSLRQPDPKPKPSRLREALVAGVGRRGGSDGDDEERHDAVAIGFGVTDVSCDDTGPGRTKRARLHTEQPLLVRC